MRPVSIHVRTGNQGDGQRTYAISVPRAYAAHLADRTFLPELLPGGTLVFRPMVPVYEPLSAQATTHTRQEEDRGA